MVWVFVCGSFLVPHPADAWAGLCISGVAYLNHRLLFLEDYEGGGGGALGGED